MNTPRRSSLASRERRLGWGRVWLIAWLAIAAALLARPLLLSGGASQQVASASPTAGSELRSAAQTQPSTQLRREFRPIEELRVGDRVVSDNPDVAPADKLGGKTAVDPATWRMLRLYAEERWPDGTLDTIHITTLQPPEWVALWDAHSGGEVPPPLDLVEMGLAEDLMARVVANEPCPPLEDPLAGPDPGRLVLTTVNHLNNDVWELTATPVRGPPSAASQDSETQEEVHLAEAQTLNPTGFHKFYSETRSEWVSTNELAPGEIIRGRAGPLRVTGAWPTPGAQRVYNLTVEGEHVYYVSQLGLLTHNNDCRRNARVLRRNLAREGRPVGERQAAGHIVASTGSKGAFKAAPRSRKILETYGVSINDAANGIPIGHPRPHNVTHNREFNEMVERRLSGVVERLKQQGRGRKSIRKALRTELRKIGRETLAQASS